MVIYSIFGVVRCLIILVEFRFVLFIVARLDNLYIVVKKMLFLLQIENTRFQIVISLLSFQRQSANLRSNANFA